MTEAWRDTFAAAAATTTTTTDSESVPVGLHLVFSCRRGGGSLL